MIRMLVLQKSAASPLASLVKKTSVTQPIYYYLKNITCMHSLHCQLKKELLSPEIILVYQMGKVASSSIFKSLKSAKIKQPVYQIHTLNRDVIQQKWRTIKLYQPYINRPVIDQDFLVSKYMSDHLDQILNRKLKIISIVRDPLQRNISDFFQNIEQYFPNFTQRFASGELGLEDVIEAFWKNHGSWGVDYAGRWFNRELKAVLGIDIMAVEFPKDKGYVILNYPDRNIEVLLLKFESFNQCLEKSLCEFFALEQLAIKDANVSQHKDYYKAYKEFKHFVKFSKEYLDKIYRNYWMSHFYTEAEINQFQRRWERTYHLS